MKMLEEFVSPESSLVAAASYDPGQRVLEVTLRPQSKKDVEKTYIYAGFPQDEWEEFDGATSKGSYFTRYVRPHYAGKLKD